MTYSDWVWLTRIDTDWHWLSLTGGNWRWFKVTDGDWRWLTVTDSDWQWLTVTYDVLQWLTVTDSEWRWLIVTEGDWWWLLVTDGYWRWLTVTYRDIPSLMVSFSDWWWLTVEHPCMKERPKIHRTDSGRAVKSSQAPHNQLFNCDPTWDGKQSSGKKTRPFRHWGRVGDACFFLRCDVLTMRCFPILNDAIFCSVFFNF